MSEVFNSDITEIHTSRKNLLKQLKTAGFNVDSHEVTLSEIYYMNVHNELDFKVSNDLGNTALVKYFMGKTIKVSMLQTITSELFTEDGFDPNINTIVIMVDNEPNSSVQETVKQIYAEENVCFIIYNIKRLLFNIHDHKLVPKHRILTTIEKERFLEKYTIINPKNELPTLSRFDPVALSIFIKPDQICEITRNSINGIESKYYRLCVNT
tara:strand:- start:45 stop:677 length:633 start_codon:yes stop_codon:yes gene_type:complete